ncbi:enoyl-CoA hydratase/isomerase family protein [Sciscionella marina]|uniref:enoyl-CoA hydratase/isomerase family protein n=1 Tax=Sciscionella marina TaxID=508770 RepID=UPI000377348F|nr:enoyl-CoA hydratase/isomerase family protein [Sciscionella marina]
MNTAEPDTGHQAVRTERTGDVVTMVLDRSSRANALDAVTVEALHDALDHVDARTTRAVVLSGGGRHFCAGFDMSGVLDASDGELLLRFVRIEQLLQRLHRAPYLTVACVAGKAIGAGADIVAACSHRLLDAGTTLRFPGFRFGVALGTRRLAQLIGTRAARQLLLASREVTADEAVRLGLGTASVDRQAQRSAAEKIVAESDGLDAPSVGAVLELTSAGDGHDASDLAALVRSLTRPGLHDRLAHYLGADRD